mgnify:CR=1 FL=1
MLGYIENPDDEKWEAPQKINKQRAKAMIDTYMTDEAFDNAFNRLKEHWNNLLSKYTLETSDDKLCRMVNIWNQYQCMCHDPLHIMSQEQAAAWDFVIHARICSDLCILFLMLQGSVFLILPQHNLKTEVHITNTSRSQNRAIPISEADSMTTRSGS